jgi:hypothetical protein
MDVDNPTPLPGNLLRYVLGSFSLRSVREVRSSHRSGEELGRLHRRTFLMRTLFFVVLLLPWLSSIAEVASTPDQDARNQQILITLRLGDRILAGSQQEMVAATTELQKRIVSEPQWTLLYLSVLNYQLRFYEEAVSDSPGMKRLLDALQSDAIWAATSLEFHDSGGQIGHRETRSTQVPSERSTVDGRRSTVDGR